MKHFNHAVLVLIIATTYFYGTTWVFNHVSPWLSIALVIFGTIFLINYTIKQLKKLK